MNIIFVKDLVVIGKHGVMQHEWSHEQQFLVDITVEVDELPGTKSDKLEDTIDYAQLCTIAQEIIEGESMYLVEKLAETIVCRILKDKRIAKATITIKKPSVLPSGVPGVTISRERAS